MGQFLAIGLSVKISIKKSEMKKADFDYNKLVKTMKTSLYFQSEIYKKNEDENFIVFTLKEEIVQTQLLDFLKSFYPHLYKDPDSYSGVLESLTSLPPSQWMEWSRKKPGAAFQYDEYGMSDYLFGNFGHSIWINYKSIILSHEGKILMESCGSQFHFFKYAMIQTFKEFSLSGALRVYITG